MRRIQERSGAGHSKRETVEQALRAQIIKHRLKPGDRLPSYADMKASHGLAPQTTDRIYSTLEREGLIVRAQGSGTFVAQVEESVGLGNGKKSFVGIVLSAIQDAFCSEILAGAEAECRKAGLHLVISNTGGSSHLEAQDLTSLADGVAGFCIFPSATPSYAAFHGLVEKKVPFVFIDNSPEKLNVSLAAADNEYAGFVATQHLLELGHRKIYLFAQGHASSIPERITGYRAALKQAGIEFDPTWVRHAPIDAQAAGYNMTRAILQENSDQEQPLAMFCINDHLARGAFEALHEAGRRIPQQACVIAVADKSAACMEPPLSAVQLDLFGMGQAAIKLLVEALKRGDQAPVRQIRLKPQLIVRNSTDSKRLSS